MASPPPGPPSWSVAVRLRHRWGLDIHAAAENVLPGWGRGGERLSLLLRFRRRLILTVTSQCGARPAVAPTQPGTPPRGGKILRFLRSRWAPLPRITSIWRRKKHTPTRASAAAAAPRGRRAQVIPSPVLFLGRLISRPIGFMLVLRLLGFLCGCRRAERQRSPASWQWQGRRPRRRCGGSPSPPWSWLPSWSSASRYAIVHKFFLLLMIAICKRFHELSMAEL